MPPPRDERSEWTVTGPSGPSGSSQLAWSLSLYQSTPNLSETASRMAEAPGSFFDSTLTSK